MDLKTRRKTVFYSLLFYSFILVECSAFYYSFRGEYGRYLFPWNKMQALHHSPGRYKTLLYAKGEVKGKWQDPLDLSSVFSYNVAPNLLRFHNFKEETSYLQSLAKHLCRELGPDLSRLSLSRRQWHKRTGGDVLFSQVDSNLRTEDYLIREMKCF